LTVGFYSAKAGTISMQRAVDITSNNVANVNTHGFKTHRASFSDLIYTTKLRNDQVETGHGVKIDKTDLMFDIGRLESTGQELDFAIPSEELFAVEDASSGQIYYTKNGAFRLSNNGDGTWGLVDPKGNYVLDYDMNPITAVFDENGNLDSAATMELIGTFKFPNPYGLDNEGDNYFIANGSSGEPEADRGQEKLQYYLEGSSVNLATEMVNLIKYQRGFSFNAKLVQTADDIEQRVNSLRR